MSLYQISNIDCTKAIFADEYRKTSRLIILEEAIAYNVNVIKSKTSARIIAVIKENGYGTGLINEYEILRKQGIDFFAVADADDALLLRDYGATEDILLMTPSYDKEELKELVFENIVVTLESERQLDTLKTIFRESKIMPRVHIKIDTGMGRYGFYYSSIPDLTSITDYVNVEGCFTHLAGGSNYKRSVRNQIQRFNQAITALNNMGISPRLMHIANSRALTTVGDCGFNAIRVGSALLGRVASHGKFKDAIWLEASVFEIVRRPKGASISYGSLVTLKKDSRLAIIRAGLGDGIGLKVMTNDKSVLHMIFDAVRSIKNRRRQGLSVRIRSRKYSVIGKPGFSHMVVNIGDDDIKEGDKVMIRVNPLLINSSVERVTIRSIS